MWHYEYTVDQMFFRFAEDSFDRCLTALLQARAANPTISDPKIFDGGTLMMGSGAKAWDQHDIVGSPVPA